jgi:hypothetical protein
MIDSNRIMIAQLCDGSVQDRRHGARQESGVEQTHTSQVQARIHGTSRKRAIQRDHTCRESSNSGIATLCFAIVGLLASPAALATGTAGASDASFLPHTVPDLKVHFTSLATAVHGAYVLWNMGALCPTTHACMHAREVHGLPSVATCGRAHIFTSFKISCMCCGLQVQYCVHADEPTAGE